MCTRSSSDRRAALALALALLLSACAPRRESPEAYAARNAVIRYDQALVEAFRASKSSRLTGVATDDEVARNAAVIAALLRDGKFMEARQIAFEVEKIRLLPDGRAEVDAAETWSYEHRPLADPARPVAPRTVRYALTYRLKRAGEGWAVDQVVSRGDGRAP